MTNKSKILSYVFLLLLLGVGLLVGASNSVSWIGFFTTLGLFLFFFKNKLSDIVKPSTFNLFLLSLVIMFIYTFGFDYRNKYGVDFVLNLATGGLLWLFFSNYPNKLQNVVKNIIVLFTLVLPPLYFLTLKLPFFSFLHKAPIFSFSLMGHSNVGDFMILPILICIFELLGHTKRKLFYEFLLIWSLLILYLSFSRSAAVGLIIGLYFLLNTQITPKIRQLKFVLISAVLLIFMIFNSHKSLFLNRQYYIQGVWGLFKYPLGLGIGRFGVISADPQSHLFGLAGYSGVAFNILLEVLTGVGVFGVVFVAWFVSVIHKVLTVKDVNKSLFRAMFLGLAANFFFNITYFDPGVLWLWFMTLGLLSPKTDASL